MTVRSAGSVVLALFLAGCFPALPAVVPASVPTTVPDESTATGADSTTSAPLPPVGEDFLQFKGSADRRGRVAPAGLALPGVPEVAFRIAGDDWVTASALARGDVVYVAGWDGRVRAVAAGDGRPRWEADLGTVDDPLCPWPYKPGGGTRRGVAATPALVEGRLVVAHADGRLEALDADTGKGLWRYRFPGGDGVALWASPLVLPARDDRGARVVAASARTCAARCERAVVAALDPATGASVWTFSPVAADGGGGGVLASPVHDARTDAVLVAFGDACPGAEPGLTKRLVALDASSGAVRWTYPSLPDDPPVGEISSTPAVFSRGGCAGRVVAFLSQAGDLFLLDVETGRPVLPPLGVSGPTVGRLASSVVRTDDGLLVVGRSARGGGSHGVVALRECDLSEAWSQAFTGVGRTPLVVGETTY
ncbi:MAG: Quinoprotein alcohol dehydrogenase, partial [Pseudomonadota bacterium]